MYRKGREIENGRVCSEQEIYPGVQNNPGSFPFLPIETPEIGTTPILTAAGGPVGSPS